MSEWYYFDILLLFSQKIDKIAPVFIIGSIEQSLRSVFGEIGGLTSIDLLKFDGDTRRTIIRVPASHYVKTRAALTLIGEFQGISCHFRVLSASPILSGLLQTHLDF